MPTLLDIGLDARLWRELDRRHRKSWGSGLLAVGVDGVVVFGRPGPRDRDALDCRAARAFAVREALRWGEPTVEVCPCRRLIWAAPLMRNEKLLGGVVAGIPERDFFRDGAPILDVRRACEELRLALERENLTNASALALRRAEYQDEQRRAYALHAVKNRGHDNIRELYLNEEPALFSAIRAGDRPRAREILNRILVAIHHHAGSRLELVKSLFLELVVSMSRTAVEAGGAPEALLGDHYTRMTELAGIDGLERLAAWLSKTLEQMMDVIGRHRRRGAAAALFGAMAFMEKHCGERISRDEAAQAAHLSPSHFSHMVRKETGSTFTEWLNRLRVDRAAEMLARTDKPLAVVAIECGFEDQSYFTKVFRRYRNCPPGLFRRRTGLADGA